MTQAKTFLWLLWVLLLAFAIANAIWLLGG
jgi:hypothetical protein